VDLIITPTEGCAKTYRRGNKILIYVGRLHYRYDVLTITPRSGITAQQRAELVGAYKWLPQTLDVWKPDGDGGWVTHLSLPAPFRVPRLSRRDPHRARVRQLLCPEPEPSTRPIALRVACAAAWKAPAAEHRR
jgi:hypothetical protein